VKVGTGLWRVVGGGRHTFNEGPDPEPNKVFSRFAYPAAAKVNSICPCSILIEIIVDYQNLTLIS
jgi:hypothetical protein